MRGIESKKKYKLYTLYVNFGNNRVNNNIDMCKKLKVDCEFVI